MNLEAEEKVYEKGTLAKTWGLCLDPHPLIFLTLKFYRVSSRGRGEVEMEEMSQITGA